MNEWTRWVCSLLADYTESQHLRHWTWKSFFALITCATTENSWYWLPKYIIAYISWLHSHWGTLQGHWSKELLHAITNIQKNGGNSSSLFSTCHIKQSFLCKQKGVQIAKIILIKIIFLTFHCFSISGVWRLAVKNKCYSIFEWF